MNFQFSQRMASLKPSTIREILKSSADPSMISLAAGNPAVEAFPVEIIKDLIDQIMTEQPIQALQYSITEGYPLLREEVSKLLAQRYGIQGDHAQIMIVSGAQQAIELACKVLCDEGDVVLCESPSFIGSLNAFRSYGTRLVGIDMEEDGVCLASLEKALSENPKAKFIYLIPNFQNPRGTTMSWEKRKAAYELACRYNTLIVEDNPYGELRFEGEHIPPIKTLDTDGRVIHCGSFSKILAPGIRIGFAATHSEVINKMAVGKQCEDVHSNMLAQLVCYKFLTQHDLDAHIASIRAIYKHKCNLMLSEMDQHFSPKVSYTRPQGGLFIYCTLPEGSDVLTFCRKAIEKKVAVVPGNAFSVDETAPSDSFRLNFSTPTDENIVKGIRILGELTKELF